MGPERGTQPEHLPQNQPEHPPQKTQKIPQKTQKTRGCREAGARPEPSLDRTVGAPRG